MQKTGHCSPFSLVPCGFVCCLLAGLIFEDSCYKFPEEQIDKKGT